VLNREQAQRRKWRAVVHTVDQPRGLLRHWMFPDDARVG
jgi:hypothetical protein